MIPKKRLYFFSSLLFISVMLFYHPVHSQNYSTLTASFYQNKFTLNPASINGEQTTIWLGYSTMNINIDGRPEIMFLTSTTPISSNMGLGATLSNERIGFYNRTRFSGAYQYGIKISSDKKLMFGLSLGTYLERILNDKVDQKTINSGILDSYNQNSIELETGVGMSYQDKNWNIGASIPSMRRTNLSPNSIPYFVFNATYSYKRHLVSFEPIINMMLYKNYQNLLNIGIQCNFSNRLELFTIHNPISVNKNTVFGMNYISSHSWNILLSYYFGIGTVQQEFGLGKFEIGFGMNFDVKKKSKKII